MNRNRFFVIVIFCISISLYPQSDFENNFLEGYLNFEKFFQQLSGDYGGTFFPFLNSRYGGRDLGLSGAFTGVADDITTIEINPAGTASLKYTELFFSHNKLMGDVNFNTLAYAIRLNDLGLALSARILYIPFTHYDNFGDVVSSGMISYSVITLNGSYNFLRTYDFFGISVGGNIKLYIYGVPENIAANQTTVNVSFDFGFLTRFNFLKGYSKNEKNFSVGLAIKNLGPFSANEPPPTTISTGIGYKPIEQLLLSLDFNYLISYSEFTYKTWSINTGIEWKFTKYTSLLFGAMIKSSPSFSLGINLDFDDFSITATYNPDFIDLSRFSVSASLKFGDLGRYKKDTNIKILYINALKYMNQGDYETAKMQLEDILKKDKGFTPARKSLENCNEALKINKKLKEYYKDNNQIK